MNVTYQSATVSDLRVAAVKIPESLHTALQSYLRIHFVSDDYFTFLFSYRGAMSDTKIQFDRPDDDCRDKIIFQRDQLTASSYWITDEEDPKKT